MLIPLVGGPRDGQIVDVPVATLGFIDADGEVYSSGQPWIDDDFEMYFPHDAQTVQPIAVYRWLFGAADHLDFAGWQK